MSSILPKRGYAKAPISPSPIALEQMAAYRLTATQREKARLQNLQGRRSHGITIAQQAAQLLKQWGATRVMLFGSILTEYFHETSDQDIAVQDLPEQLYFRAVAQLQDISSFTIDLVEINYAALHIQEAIAQGREL